MSGASLSAQKTTKVQGDNHDRRENSHLLLGVEIDVGLKRRWWSDRAASRLHIGH